MLHAPFMCLADTLILLLFYITPHTRCFAPGLLGRGHNEGLDLTFDKDRRRGTDLEGEGKRLDRPNIG